MTVPRYWIDSDPPDAGQGEGLTALNDESYDGTVAYVVTESHAIRLASVLNHYELIGAGHQEVIVAEPHVDECLCDGSGIYRGPLLCSCGCGALGGDSGQERGSRTCPANH